MFISSLSCIFSNFVWGDLTWIWKRSHSNEHYLSSSEIQACTGFEPMTSAVLVQCSTNWELVTVLVPNKPVKWWIKDREDRFHIHVFPRSSNIWLSCIHSRSRSYLLPHSEDIGYVTIKFTWSLGPCNIHIIPPRWQFIGNQIFLSPLSILCWWRVIPPFLLKTMRSPPKSSNPPY